MKRDMNLIREILLTVQDTDTAGGVVELKIPDHDRNEIGYHVALLIDAGYLDGSTHGSPASHYGFIIRRLTWDGHEFLDLARNESIWRKALGRLGESGLDTSIAILKALLASLVAQALGLEH